ncbi:hypothetical protein HYT51_02540 [Candidatus Woesearchaeota archaeon]|nr:hypothetical protein [Candidatus Woesearchaeota archaeon]
MTSATKILAKLDEIKIELGYIKENMVDKDMVLTKQEKKLLEESYKNEKKGKLLSSNQLRKQLGI